MVVVVPVYSGDDLDEGERLLRPLRDFGAPVADSIAPVSCAEVSSAMDDLAPAGRRYSWRSAFVTDLDDGTIDTLATGFDRVSLDEHTGADRPHARGGDPDRADRDGVPASWGRFQPDPVCRLGRPRRRQTKHRLGRRGVDAHRPHATGVYVSTLGTDGDRHIREAYGPNYDRLTRIKATYDPANFFRMNQNIEPRAHGG